MTDNIVSFQTRDGVIGDGVKLDPDAILEANKGAFTSLAIVGIDKDGIIQICMTDTIAETLLMLDVAKAKVINQIAAD